MSVVVFYLHLRVMLMRFEAIGGARHFSTKIKRRAATLPTCTLATLARWPPSMHQRSIHDIAVAKRMDSAACRFCIHIRLLDSS